MMFRNALDPAALPQRGDDVEHVPMVSDIVGEHVPQLRAHLAVARVCSNCKVRSAHASQSSPVLLVPDGSARVWTLLCEQRVPDQARVPEEG